MIDAQVYGRALYQVSQDNGNTEQIMQELEDIYNLIKENRVYVDLMDSPALPSKLRLDMLKSAFASADPMLLNFMCLLCEKHSFYKLETCRKVFAEIYDEEHAIVRAKAVTALPLTQQQTETIRQKLCGITGKNILLENVIDESIISGIVLRCGSMQLDDSLKGRLDALRRSLSETTV